jgi:DNA mismatch repair protein MutS2
MINILQSEPIPDSILHEIEWNILCKKWSCYAHFLESVTQLEKIPSPIDHPGALGLYQELQKLEQFMTSDAHMAWKKYIEFIPSDFDSSLQEKYLNLMSLLHFNEINAWVLFCEAMLEVEQQEKIKEFSKLMAKNFRCFVKKNGDVELWSHPTLGPLMTQLSHLEKFAQQQMEQLLSSSALSSKIESKQWMLRGGVYTVAVRSDRYEQSLGRIIDRSGTGSTLYIEPASSSELSLKRRNLLIKIDEEISKLEMELSAYCHEYRDYLIEAKNACLKLDYKLSLILARKNEHWCLPTFFATPKMTLINCAHPLLVDPVFNDFSLNEKQRLLLISGPNTGGKTAFLKTIILAQLMSMKGLGVRAESADLYLYPSLFVSLNNTQSLNMGLSSFATEVVSILSYLESSVQKPSLIFIDEIFNSTSSEEASLLAFAFIEYVMANREDFLFITSHHQTLKARVNERKEFISAHVGFNVEEQTPTYKIHFEGPGSSFALETFKRYLSKTSLYQDYLPYIQQVKKSELINYEELLQQLQQREQELENELMEQKNVLKQLQATEAAQKLKLVKDHQILLTQWQKKFHELELQAHQYLSQVKQGDVKSYRAIEHKFHDLKKELPQQEVPEKIVVAAPKEVAKILEVGQFYFATTLQKDVELIKLSGNTATVKAGPMVLRLDKSNLRMPQKFHAKKQDSVTVNIFKSTHTPMTLDARGKRLDEFQSQVEYALMDLAAGEIPSLEIIHGHGEGVLKQWLRQYLQQQKNTFSYTIPEHSGDGSTLVTVN